MSHEITTFVTWLGVLGIPSIFSMSLWCIRACVKFTKTLNILMEAQQKQMARDLTVDYKVYIMQGWIDPEDMDLWEAQYQKYHALGANGIMDNKRAKLLALPSIPPQA